MKSGKVLTKSIVLIMAGIMGVMLDYSMAGGTTGIFGTGRITAEAAITDYTYTITPLLKPFNEYFFVKTDNPDPTSFRFVDKSSAYKSDGDAAISFDWSDWDEEVKLYADIKYENPKTGRVNGGYIFKSYDTDGGTVVLQTKNSSNDSWNVTWSDTNVKIKLPALKDEVDYLIDTYATKDSFFDNMDAVQSGFSSICFYSGSNIRGKLVKTSDYWSAAVAGHIDQSFYIYSPYDREGSESLFATALYPFRYDSLGFPGMMAAVSKRLNSASSYEWSKYSHADILVTYQGETHTYGGAGNGEGQGISKDKIQQYFSFNPNGTKITLKGLYQLLQDYSRVEMADDIPRKNALTWKKICDRVGKGSWVRLKGGYYTYFYKKNDGDNFWAEDWSAGNSIYWGGDLQYCSDTWVDGRYIGKWRHYVPGEKFEDHQTSSIILNNVTIPKITYDCTYQYNSSTGKYDPVYSNIKITETKKNVMFLYNQQTGRWNVEDSAFDGNADCEKLAELVEQGLVEQKYLDMVTLTLKEVKALNVDRNTNKVPVTGYLYDGTAKPGTRFVISSIAKAAVTVKNASYTGSAIIPSVTVKVNGKTLKKDTDYTVACKNNINPGTATVTITGKDNYTGTIHKTFTIKPAAVTALEQKASSTTSSISMTWKKVPKATGYEVYRAASRNGKYTKVTATASNSYTNKGLKAGTTYYYKVRAYKTIGKTKLYGNFSTIVTMAAKTAAPRLKVTSGRGSVKITWNKVTGASGYEVYMLTSQNGSSRKIWTTSSKTTSYTKTGLAGNEKYYFKVRAYKIVNRNTWYSGYSSVKAVKVAR